MILMIDNYDSFTYNIVQYLGELGADVEVFRNDEITCEEIKKLKPNKIVISPGPCTPNEAGISLEVINSFSGQNTITWYLSWPSEYWSGLWWKYYSG